MPEETNPQQEVAKDEVPANAGNEENKNVEAKPEEEAASEPASTSSERAEEGSEDKSESNSDSPSA